MQEFYIPTVKVEATISFEFWDLSAEYTV